LAITFDEALVYAPYEKVNHQTSSLIKRFGLDDRLFTRVVDGVSVDSEFVGAKRNHGQMAKYSEKSD